MGFKWHAENNIEVDKAVRVIEQDGYTYIGLAPPGSEEGASVWQIKRVDESSGTVVLWADGTSAFIKRWNLATTYVYS